MSLPEFECFAKCATRPSFRRVLIGILVAVATFAIGVWLSGSEDRSKVVRTSSSATLVLRTTRLVDVPYPPVTQKYELYPSPDWAAQEFELQLQEAGDYKDLLSCRDENGNPVGQRALLINPGRRVNTAGWRIVWTVRSEKSSELFLIESNSLPQLRILEHSPRPNWKPCL